MHTPSRLLRSHLLLAVALMLVWTACASLVPRQGWDPGNGPVVPHDTFPADFSLCHAGKGWTELRADFTYDHAAQTGYELRGAHRTAQCLECHNDRGPVAAFAARGCAGCHEDVHRGAFGNDCTTCHGQERPFREAPGFRHESFALSGAHAQATCTACHAEGTDRSVVSYRTRRPEARSCSECHENVHVATAARGPVSLQFPDSADCSRCHQPTRWAEARMGAADHARTGFALAGSHAAVACAECHGDATRAPRHGRPAPAERDCAACHESPHTQVLLGLAAAAPA